MKVYIILFVAMVVFSTSFSNHEQVKPQVYTVKVLDYKLHKVKDAINRLYKKKYLTPDQKKLLKTLTDSVTVLKRELKKLGVKK